MGQHKSAIYCKILGTFWCSRDL